MGVELNMIRNAEKITTKEGTLRICGEGKVIKIEDTC